MAASDATDVLIVLVEVFAPSNVPTRVVLEWSRDGEPIRTSREVEIVAHEAGFRIWDSWRPGTAGLPTGDYEITLRTAGNRVFGVAELTVGDS